MDVEGIGQVLGRASELRSKITNSIHNSSTQQTDLNATKEERESEQTGEADDETEENLSDILDAFESLEAQLSSLQALQQQQIYEREAALAEIDYGRQKLLKKLTEYKGDDLEVISEAIAFASETVEDNNDLLLPPYPCQPSRSLVPDNGYLPQFPSHQNGTINGDPSDELRMSLQDSVRNRVESKPKSSIRLFVNAATKTVFTLVGVISVLSLAGFGSRLRKRDAQFKVLGLFQRLGDEAKIPMVQCPPGKALVIENGETRCLVKERVEIPFESVFATADVNYGCG